tara:strand:- start:560 stop:823 length:264 start_codon:yes stop_codon:yes gene_type:complete
LILQDHFQHLGLEARVLIEHGLSLGVEVCPVPKETPMNCPPSGEVLGATAIEMVVGQSDDVDSTGTSRREGIRAHGYSWQETPARIT